MKIISDLYKHIRSDVFYQAQFHESKEKTNILFFDPAMNNYDLYSMLIPFLSLPEDDNFQTAITGLYRESEIKEENRTTVITKKEVLWADIVVVPMTLEPFYEEGDLFDSLREINPSIKIIQSVEFDFYSVPKDHFLFKDLEVPEEAFRVQLESNLNKVDRIVVLNENLAKKLIQKGFKDVKTIPIIIDQESFIENVDFAQTLGIKNATGTVFMSIDLTPENKHVFLIWLPILIDIKKKYKNLFRIVVTGTKIEEFYPDKDIFEYDFIKRGSIIHQLKSIVQTSADIHLQLNSLNEYYNNSENEITFVEHGLFGVPIVTMNVSPFNTLIENKKNGFILKSRKSLSILIESLIKSKKEIVEISTDLKSEILTNYSNNDQNFNKLKNAFIFTE